MPRVSIKQHLVKWYLATLDAELEVFRFNSLANFLDTELSSLLGHLGSADSGSTQSSPVSINLSALIASSSSASSYTQSSLSTEFIMKSSDTGSTISFPWDDKEIEIRVALQASFQRRYTIKCQRLDKSSEFILNIAPNLPDDWFKQFFWVSHPAFGKLLEMIQDHPVFGPKQASVV